MWGERGSRLVQDNLNIHAKASLYEAFPAPEARRLVERFEWHGSWLDLAESATAEIQTQQMHRYVIEAPAQLSREEWEKEYSPPAQPRL